jgi:chromosome segregation protein
MSLLSGGEKALSAIAFIFAIFLIKPGLFLPTWMKSTPPWMRPISSGSIISMKVIGEKSQIIMITHNKRSMEFAETLYRRHHGAKRDL